MFCKYCGSEISDDALFCKSCGKKLTSADGQDSAPVPSENTDTPLADVEPLFHDHDTEESSSGKPSWFGKHETTRISKKEFSPKRIFALAAAAGLVVILFVLSSFVVFPSEKQKAKDAYSIFERKMDYYNFLVDKYNAYKTSENAKNMETAGLDMMEAYMDYYEHEVKSSGKKDYAKMNMYIDTIFITIEDNHNGFYPWGASDYNHRMALIKNRWKYLKR